MRRQDVIRFAGSLVLAGTLAGLTPLATAATTRTVEAGSGGFRFDPSTRTIARGDRIVWDNVSGFEHDVTSRLAGYFRSNGQLGPGQDYARTFPAAGTFGYFCKFHELSGMTGRIVVPIRVSLSGGLFTIRVATASSSGTKWRNQVQVRRPGSSTWHTIATTTGTTVTFDPGPHGTYRFRSAVRNKDTGARSAYSPVVSKVY
jgi:plastocyanin